MIKSNKIKTVVGKECNIGLLKGIKYKDFKKQILISKTVAREFLKSKDKKLTRKCTICGNKKFRFATRIFKIDFIQCKKCSHVSQKYYYSINFLKSFWKRKGNVINVHSHSNQQTYRRKFLSKSKVDMVLKYFKRKKNAKWLDAGCGNGHLLENVKRRKIIPFGFDLNERDIDLAKKKRVNAFRTDIEGFYEIAKQNNLKFDVASANGYFDEVVEPALALRLINKMMKKNGLLMISIPNYESVTHEMIRLYPNEAIRHLTPGQRSSFTLKSLLYLLNKNGFKPIFRWKYGLDLYMIMNYLSQKNKKFENSKTMMVLSKRYNEIQKIFDEENCSGSLFFIARKIRG